MKSLITNLSLFVTLACSAQNSLLIATSPISDLSQTPVYSILTEESSNGSKWKPEYVYLDDIEISGITYLSEGLKVKGLLVKPKKSGNYPCVIFNRGGNQDFGSLTIATAAITMGQIAKEGYVVIASQYRGNGGSEGKEEFGGKDINDVLILTEVLKEVEGADISRIGMFGWSRGGMMTYLALSKTNKIKAAAVGGALADSEEMIRARPEMEGVYAELVPDYTTNKEQELQKRSAVRWVDKFPKDVPVLLLHGGADWRVKPEQSLRMAALFQEYGVPYRLIIFEGDDHGISEHKDEVTAQVIAWFDRFVKNGEPLPNVNPHGE